MIIFPMSDFLLFTVFLSLSQLGVQIDGYCSTVAHTIVVGASAEKPVTGEKADVIQAAHTALQAAVRMIRPGNKVSYHKSKED